MQNKYQTELNCALVLPKGFSYYGTNAGFKPTPTKDFAVIFSEIQCNAAAVFTSHRFPGAPISVGKEHIKDGSLQACVINSSIANVGTGKKGIENAENTTELLAAELGINKQDILPSSTGVINRFLDMNFIKNAIPGIKQKLSTDSFKDAAEAIMTTDKYHKWTCVKVGDATISAMAKGAGMINPNMATMLCYIQTDAKIDSQTLDKMLRHAVNKSFNRITVDGDMSTSDTVVVMANGLAGTVGEKDFQQALTSVCITLAKSIVRDGEGATKLVEIIINGAADDNMANKIARKVATSPLVKTALYGSDPNTGRLYGAIGGLPEFTQLDVNKLSIYIGDMCVYDKGEAIDFDIEKCHNYMKQEELVIKADLGIGKASFNIWTCDLTEEYININAHYTT